MDTSSATLPFSVENFVKLFEVSRFRKYLSLPDLQQIQRAIYEKDVLLLNVIYQTLLEEQKSNGEVIGKFIDKKNKIMDGMIVQCVDLHKKYITEPQKKVREADEAEEQVGVESILDNLTFTKN